MGTQQILLIVLSVIIVGAAIAVGIQMFNAQSYSANKSAIAADAQTFATQIIQYYKTPISQGGLGGKLATEGTAIESSVFYTYLGWETTGTTNDNGTYTIAVADNKVTITGVGKEVKSSKKPEVVTEITFPAGTIEATLSDIDA